MRRLLRLGAVAVAAIVALAAAFVAVFDVRLRDGVGERFHVVENAQDLRSEYRLGVGDLRVDLSSVVLPAGETHMKARIDVGQVRVIVPDGVALRVRADAQFGDIDLLEKSTDGYDVEATLDEDGARVLVLDAHVGVGAIDVTRAVR